MALASWFALGFIVLICSVVAGQSLITTRRVLRLGWFHRVYVYAAPRPADLRPGASTGLFRELLG